MNDIIELPAEANPLNGSILLHVLKSASSADQQQVETGTKQLQRWETEKGYYSSLQSIYIDQSLPLEVRYLAIIQLKNGIDKYWRKTASNAINKAEKAEIRRRLLDSGVNESHGRLAIHNALVTAKIIRIEYPLDWPDAISDIINRLRLSSAPDSARLWLPRVLRILLQVVKELSTGRLQRNRTNLQSMTPELVHILASIYIEKNQRWKTFLEKGGDDEGGALDDLEQSLLAAKILRRLLIVGYEFPNRNKEVEELWLILQVHWEEYLQIVMNKDSPFASSILVIVSRHLIQLSKLHLEMAEVHPAAFVHLPNSLDIIRAYWQIVKSFGESYVEAAAKLKSQYLNDLELNPEEKPITERLTIKGLLLSRACLRMIFHPVQTFKYRHAREKEEQSRATALLREELYTDSVVIDWMREILTHFFVFRQTDLHEWEEDPEEWETREEKEGEGLEFSVRASAERLFLDLVINFKSVMVEPLLETFHRFTGETSDNLSSKDSIYTAIGLAAPVLSQKIDFDQFISDVLIKDIQKNGSGQNFLRRRIAILLGQWISVNISEKSKPIVYQIFHHLLNADDPTNDQVVRITAAKQFKLVASEWDFKKEQFVSIAPEVLSKLMALIQEVNLTETKMAILDTISVIVERLEHDITPYADRIVSLLPPLWEQSGEEHLMKQAILVILIRLINSMKAESQRYHSLVIPIIRGAVEPGSVTQTFLLEDALELWSAVVVQTVTPISFDVLSLASYLFHVFELGAEALLPSLRITESYILLAPSFMLENDMRHKLLASFTMLLKSPKIQPTRVITQISEILIRSAEALGGEQAIQILVSDMAQTGFLGNILKGINGSWKSHQTTGPKREYPPIDRIIELDYFLILARLALASPFIFYKSIRSLVSDTATMSHHTLDQESENDNEMNWLLEEWFESFDSIAEPKVRKLTCLALTNLLQIGRPWILSKLQDLMTIWTDVASELKEGMDDSFGDTLVYKNTDEIKPEGMEAPEDIRRRQLVFSDPVHQVNITGFIRTQIENAVKVCGGQENFHNDWIVNIDKDILQSFDGLRII